MDLVSKRIVMSRAPIKECISYLRSETYKRAIESAGSAHAATKILHLSKDTIYQWLHYRRSEWSGDV